MANLSQFAFLLTLLPNIEQLALPNRWNSQSVYLPCYAAPNVIPDIEKSVPALVSLIVTQANDVESIPGTAPLRKLRTLLPTADVDHQSGVHIATIAPFLALDSMRDVRHERAVCDEVVGRNLADDNYGISVLDFQREGLYPVLGRHIETLSLTDAVMVGSACDHFFQDMHNLKVLTIDYNMKDEIGWDWNIDVGANSSKELPVHDRVPGL